MTTSRPGRLPAGTGLLAVAADPFDVVYLALAPEIGRSTGLGPGALSLLFTLKLIVSAGAGLALATVVQKHPWRWVTCIYSVALWSVSAVVMAVVGSASAMIVVLILAGVAGSSVRALHPAVLRDARAQAFGAICGHQVARLAWTALTAAAVAVLCSADDLTWRAVYLAAAGAGVLALVVALMATGGETPPDPVVAQGGDAGSDLAGTLGGVEALTRLMRSGSFRQLASASAMAGAFFLLLPAFVPRVLIYTRAAGSGQIGATIMIAALVAVTAVVGFRVALGSNPTGPRTLMLASIVAGAGSVSWALSMYFRSGPGFYPLAVLGFAAIASTTPAITTVALDHVHPNLRTYASAALGGAATLGGVIGLQAFEGLSLRIPAWWVAALIFLALGGNLAGSLYQAARALGPDLDALAGELAEEEHIRNHRSSLPLLACRGVDYFYGQQQVLFGVDFTMAEGEMVALLGTNGAGKSTLLRAISGLGYPSAGTIRLRGINITHMNAERRTAMGIIQVLGGRAVFAPLTVAQNMRLFGYVHGSDRAGSDRGIDRAFEAFPSLHALRNQPAATLSGGQQQMLALSRAFIVPPRLLLIDELSLGLAPKIVEELLGAVRQINDSGVAVVLVEQSVNIALSVVKHAYFMEKGEIRFDGPADELIGRGDLLRSVFLEGAASRTQHDHPATAGSRNGLSK